MKLPEAAKVEFEPLVTRELESSSRVKRRLKAGLAEELSPAAERVLQGAQRQLGRLERKTSPLYVRLVHALVDYLLLPERDWALAALVHDAVAHSTKRFELKLEQSG